MEDLCDRTRDMSPRLDRDSRMVHTKCGGLHPPTNGDLERKELAVLRAEAQAAIPILAPGK